jgi:hypothetical protein
MNIQMLFNVFIFVLRRLNIDSDGVIDGDMPGNSIIVFMDVNGRLFDAFSTKGWKNE